MTKESDNLFILSRLFEFALDSEAHSGSTSQEVARFKKESADVFAASRSVRDRWSCGIRPGASRRFAGCRGESSPTDCYGDPLPPGAVMRLGTCQFRDNGQCYAVAYSPDGKLLATAGYGGVVLWDAHSGKRQGFLKSKAQWADALGEFNHGNVHRLAFSSDGRYLAAGCEGATLVWELATGKASYLPGDRYKSATDLVGFAPDNRGVFTGDSSKVQLRDRKSGQVLKQWTPPLPPSSREKEVGFGSKALSADGKIVVAYVFDYKRKKYSLRVWDVGSGEGRQIEGVPGSLALSTDHTLLAALDQNLTLFDVATGKAIRSWPVKKRKSGAEIRPFGPLYPGPQEIAFSPDGKSVAIPGVVWSVTTGKELCKLDDDGLPVFGLSFSPDGKTLAAGRGSWIDFWKLPTGQKVRDFPNHRGSVVDLAYSPDGRQLATAGSDNTVRLWDARTGRLIRSFGKDGSSIRSLVFFPDGQRLATTDERSVAIWNTSDGKELWEIHNPCWPSRFLNPVPGHLSGRQDCVRRGYSK